MPRKPKAEKRQADTERVAWEMYANRYKYKPGTRLDKNKLWEEAEKIVRSPIRTTLFASHRPLIKLEKRLWEPLLAWANDQAMLSLLGLVGNLGLIIAVATYIGSEKQRRDAEVLNAWQTISSAYGQSGSGGRIQALEFLNASPSANWRRKFPWVCAPFTLCVWEAENLAGINLSIPDGEGAGAYLEGVELPEAQMRLANLRGANLEEANLRGANLEKARLRGAHLVKAKLQEANLQGAFLMYADLEGADLDKANIEGTDLGNAKIEGALNLTQDQLVLAKLCRTTFPDGITLDPNRDCQELKIDPETGEWIGP